MESSCTKGAGIKGLAPLLVLKGSGCTWLSQVTINEGRLPSLVLQTPLLYGGIQIPPSCLAAIVPSESRSHPKSYYCCPVTVVVVVVIASIYCMLGNVTSIVHALTPLPS